MLSLTAGQYFSFFYTICSSFATGTSPDKQNPSAGINALESLSGNDVT
jgi:hypothetical protein